MYCLPESMRQPIVAYPLIDLKLCWRMAVLDVAGSKITKLLDRNGFLSH